MKRAVLYARVSSEDLSKGRRNLAGQLWMCRQYARERRYRIVAWLHEDDRGASGASWDLPQLSKALEMAYAGAFDVLVVRELDRLARDLAKQLFVESEFKRAGASIEYVLAEYPDTAEGNLMKNVRATVAEYERLKIAERMRRGRRNKVKAGYVSAGKGQAPYGYKNAKTEDDKNTLEICEDEAQVVRQVFTWYAGDGLSLHAIAVKLTELGTPTWRDLRTPDKGKTCPYGYWTKSRVRDMLRREVYAGVWHFGKHKNITINKKLRRVTNPRESWIPVSVPALVDRTTWQKAQERLDQNKRNALREPKYEYLMRTRLTCVCGYKIVTSARCQNQNKLYRYYRCPSRDKSAVPESDCDLPYFRADQVDAVVWEWVKERFTPEHLERGFEAYQADREKENLPVRARIETIDDKLEDKRVQLDRLLDLYLTGEFSQDKLIEHKQRLEANIANLERERAGLVGKLNARVLTREQIQSIEEFAAEFAEGFELADRDFDARRRAIESVDVQGTLIVEEGEKVVHVSCVLGRGVLYPESATSRNNRRAGSRR